MLHFSLFNTVSLVHTLLVSNVTLELSVYIKTFYDVNVFLVLQN